MPNAALAGNADEWIGSVRGTKPRLSTTTARCRSDAAKIRVHAAVTYRVCPMRVETGPAAEIQAGADQLDGIGETGDQERVTSGAFQPV
jgi:hypothetical protein